MPGEVLLFQRTLTNVQEDQGKYRWVSEGPNCAVCNLMRGRVYSLIVWWDTVVPGFHPHCNCRLEKVAEDTPESSLDIFGVEPWIDRLSVNTFTRWWVKRLMPWDVTQVTALTEAYQETGNWSDAFAHLEKITRSNSLFSNPRLLIYNSQHPFSPIFDWLDGIFTSRAEGAPVPSASLPYEDYR